MSGNLATVREKTHNHEKVRERSGNLYSRGNLMVEAQQNNLPVLHSYPNHFLCVIFTEIWINRRACFRHIACSVV